MKPRVQINRPRLKGMLTPDKVHTYEAGDGLYYDPNKLESYFIPALGPFERAINVEFHHAWNKLVSDLEKDLDGTK